MVTQNETCRGPAQRHTAAGGLTAHTGELWKCRKWRRSQLKEGARSWGGCRGAKQLEGSRKLLPGDSGLLQGPRTQRARSPRAHSLEGK